MKHFPLFGILLLALVLSACKNDNKTQTADPAATAAADTVPRTQMANPYIGGACDLLTDDEFVKVFGVDLAGDGAYIQNIKEQAACARTWRKKDWREREVQQQKNMNLAISTENQIMIQVIDYKEGHIAIDYMRALAPEMYKESVSGVGDEAKWAADIVTLAFRKGPFRINVKVDASDNAAENLEKAKEVAQLILPKVVNPLGKQ